MANLAHDLHRLENAISRRQKKAQVLDWLPGLFQNLISMIIYIVILR